MKPCIRPPMLAALVGVALTARLVAQAAPVTYQGELRDNGQCASGIYDLRFAIYGTASGGSPVGGVLTNAATAVSNGLFTVTLDFGPGVFTGPDRWLEIGVRDSGSAAPFEVPGARQPLTPTPYAHYAYSVSGSNLTGTVAMSNLPPNLVRSDDGTVEWTGLIRFHGPVEFDQSSGPPFAVVSSADLVPGLNAEMLGWRTAEGFWQTGGNTGTTPGTHFLGTTDDRALVMKVNSQRALMLSPKGDSWTSSDGEPDGAVNIVAGSPANYAGWSNPLFDAVGVTISGGGASNLNGAPQPNRASGDYSTIGGGADQNIATEAAFATIGGGHQNAILTGSESATVGGGDYNWIFDRAYNAVIAGGGVNAIGTNSAEASIGGGVRNRIEADTRGGTISGGTENSIQTNALWATVGGGFRNRIQSGAEFAVIGGGSNNVVEARAPQTFIGGGMGNTIGESARSAVISGGEFNDIRSNAFFGFIGGGLANTLEAGNIGSSIGGGRANQIHTIAADSTISGGQLNTVEFGAKRATIAGGSANLIATNAEHAAVGGGFWNEVTAAFGTIAGGGYYSSQGNVVSDEGGFVGGGGRNQAGNTNEIATDAYFATVAGGWRNQAGAKYATVPGGLENAALGDLSFAAGRRAKANHHGAFVWADATDADFPSSGINQFLIRATGGVGINTTNPAAPLHVQSSADQDARIRLGAASWPAWEVKVVAGNEPTLAFNNLAADAMTVSYFGTVTATAFNPTSDRHAKENIQAVNARAVLEKVAALPITQWNFKTQPETVHIGPMAQDFHAAFGVGTDERHIATVDADGVALAAIQGLNEKVETRSQNSEVSIQELRTENAALKARLERLEQLVARQFTKGQ